MSRPFNNPKPLPPNFTCFYSSIFFSSISIYMIILFTCQKQWLFQDAVLSLYCVPTGTVWRLAGDVLHIPWAQDLLLVSFCGCCEVQLVLFVSPVEQSVSNMAWKPFCKAGSNCMWRRRVISQRVSPLCHSYSVYLAIILLFSDYLTHVFTCHLLQACLCIKHSVGMWNSWCWGKEYLQLV